MNYVSNSVWGMDTSAQTSIKAASCCISLTVGTVLTTFGSGLIYFQSYEDLSEDLSQEYLIAGSILTVAGSVFLTLPPLYCAAKCYLNKCWCQKSSTDYPKETSAFNRNV